MTKKNRLIVLFIGAVLFFIITPYIISYSLGYRIDLANKEIVATGGIYVRVLPPGTDVIVDTNIDNKTGLFSNSVFVQNLLPREHSILIKKEGYYDYQKNLAVEENEVTKLENVILFKQRILFDLLDNSVDYFSIAPDGKNLLLIKYILDEINFETINLENQQRNSFELGIEDKKTIPPITTDTPFFDLKWSDDSNKVLLNIESRYFLLEPFSPTAKIAPLSFPVNSRDISFNPQDSEQIFFIQNKNLYLNKQKPSIIKDVISYQIVNQNIIWLSNDGFLYSSDIDGKTKHKISEQIFPIKKNSSYKIINISGMLFLQEDESLFLLNKDSRIFETFHDQVQNIKNSPDGQKILYFNDYEILYSLLNSPLDEQNKILLIKTQKKINDVYWLNSDYVIFESENVITIAEIDNRGNINTINLSPTVSLFSGKNIDIKKPKIYFNQQDKKLYILTQLSDAAQGKGNLLVSEKLIP